MDARDQQSSRWNVPVAVVAAGACVALAGLVLTAGAQPAAQPGAWQAHKVEFNYVGIQPVYSCIGLRDALTFLLQQSGARLDGPIQTESCYRGGGAPSSLISARLRFSTLQPSADQGSGDEGNGGQASGSWRHVEFSNTRSYPQLGSADCELVQEFTTQVLPAITTRNVQSHLPCVPFQTTGFQWALTFDAFAPNGAGGQVGGGG